MDSKKIIKLSSEAKKLVEGVDDDIKSDTYQVIFRKLLDENYIHLQSKNNIATKNAPEQKPSTKKGPKYNLEELKSEGFFEKPKKNSWEFRTRRQL